VFAVLGTFILESRDAQEASEACRALCNAADGGNWRSASRALSALGRSTGADLLRPDTESALPAESAHAALRALLPQSLGPVYFSALPPFWLSMLYERLLDLRPALTPDPPGVRLHPDSRSRKESGAFFTPPYIVDFIVSEALGRIGDPASARVLDPAMGAGDFLVRSLHFLGVGDSGAARVEAAEKCLFGCDIDPIAVDIARFLVWLETDCRADPRAVARHLICADALAGDHSFRWQDAFPDAFVLLPEGPGFDAVVGNPPYVAAKSGAMGDHVGARAGRGQSDYYLLFLENVLKNRLVRRGGSLAMVLPDPFLVRGNAAEVRRTLLRDWTVESVVHVAGAFPRAQVANVLLVCSNRPPAGAEFPVVRLDKAAQRRRFEQSPRLAMSRLAQPVSPAFALAQPRAEVLYLVDGEWRPIFERIHGPEMSLSRVAAPFAFLEDLEVEAIFRGEEIGKRAIEESEGDLPVLLGGQSVHRYRIDWEGRRINRDAVLKPMEWYQGTKILLQKSSAKLVAALDEEGFIIPQSVYGIKLRPGGHHPLYLLALLNSAFLNNYAFRSFTGYKLVQPQIELEDVRRLPICRMPLSLDPTERAELAEAGRRTFEAELTGRAADFPATGELVERWLSSGKDDAAHDLVVHLAGLAIRARHEGQFGAAVAKRIDRAVDTVVERLYGC